MLRCFLFIVCLVVILGMIALLSGFFAQALFLGNEIDVKIRMWEFFRGNTVLYTASYSLVFPGQMPALPLSKLPTVQPWSHRLAYKYLFNKGFRWLTNYKDLVRAELQRKGLKTYIPSDIKTTTTVVHLRLAEVPFVRQPSYPLYRFSLYSKVIQQIHSQLKNANHHIVIISTSKSKRDTERRAYMSHTIARALQQHLTKLLPDTSVTIRMDESLADDMSIMDTCDNLIGLVGSFVFYLGLVKSRGVFYTSQHAVGDKMIRVEEADPYRIQHKEVPDYYDEVDVLQRLSA